jgi:hypothetical protein
MWINYMDSYIYIKIISKIIIYWKHNFITKIPKSNEDLRCEKYILFTHVLAIRFFNSQIMCLNLIFSKKWPLKCYSIDKKIKNLLN